MFVVSKLKRKLQPVLVDRVKWCRVRGDFRKDKSGAGLSPQDLAEQIALGVIALTQEDTTTTTDSAYFGDPAHRKKYLQDGAIIGFCEYMRQHGIPQSWKDVLRQLNFHSTPWDVTSWVVTTGGNEGNTSKSVAEAVYSKVFGDGQLPSGVESLPLYLSGDDASLTLQASALTPRGRPKKAGRFSQTFPINGNKQFSVGTHRHIKLVSRSLNIGKLEVMDQNHPYGREFTSAALQRGVVLPPTAGSVRLDIKAEFYGGSSSELKLTVTWV